MRSVTIYAILSIALLVGLALVPFGIYWATHPRLDIGESSLEAKVFGGVVGACGMAATVIAICGLISADGW